MRPGIAEDALVAAAVAKGYDKATAKKIIYRMDAEGYAKKATDKRVFLTDDGKKAWDNSPMAKTFME